MGRRLLSHYRVALNLSRLLFDRFFATRNVTKGKNEAVHIIRTLDDKGGLVN